MTPPVHNPEKGAERASVTFGTYLTLGTLKNLQTKHARSVNFCESSSPYFAIVQAQWKLRFIAAVKRRPPRRKAAFLL